MSRACRGCVEASVEAMCRGYMCRGYALRLHLQDRTTHSICSSVSLQRLLAITKQLQDIALQTPGPACQLLAQAIGLTQYTFSYLQVVASMCHTRRSGAMQNLQMHFSPFQSTLTAKDRMERCTQWIAYLCSLQTLKVSEADSQRFRTYPDLVCITAAPALFKWSASV